MNDLVTADKAPGFLSQDSVLSIEAACVAPISSLRQGQGLPDPPSSLSSGVAQDPHESLVTQRPWVWRRPYTARKPGRMCVSPSAHLTCRDELLSPKDCPVCVSSGMRLDWDSLEMKIEL